MHHLNKYHLHNMLVRRIPANNTSNTKFI